MKRLRPLLILVVLALLSGCTPFEDLSQESPYPDQSLTTPFALITWNTAKGRLSSEEEIASQLATLGRHDSVIIALQEATPSMMKVQPFGAHFARSFAWIWQESPSGVALLSTAKPVRAEPMVTPWREFGITTPKMGLAAIYPLKQKNQKRKENLSLLVVTLHGFNFEPTPHGLSLQMDRIEAMVQNHTGPCVVAGDFNTWSQERLTLVRQRLSGFSELSVRGTPGTGHPLVALAGGDPDIALDRIFYRGLLPVGPGTTKPLSLSDHAPVEGIFDLPQP